MGIVIHAYLVAVRPEPLHKNAFVLLIEELVKQTMVRAPYGVTTKEIHGAPDLIHADAYSGTDLRKALTEVKRAHRTGVAMTFASLHPEGPDVCEDACGYESWVSVVSCPQPRSIRLVNAYVEKCEVEILAAGCTYLNIVGKRAPDEDELRESALVQLFERHAGACKIGASYK